MRAQPLWFWMNPDTIISIISWDYQDLLHNYENYARPSSCLTNVRLQQGEKYFAEQRLVVTDA